MNHQSITVRTIELPVGTVVPFSSAPGVRVRIVSGRVWVTEQASLHDVFLASGQEAVLGTRGLAVIEALAPARVQLVEPTGLRSVLLKIARRAVRFLTAPWTQRPCRSAACTP